MATDYGYEAKRNSLIPHAEAYANKKIGTDKSIDEYNEKWTRCFFEKMDELWDYVKNTKMDDD